MNIHSHLRSTVHRKFTKAQHCNKENEILSVKHKYNVDVRFLEMDPMILTGITSGFSRDGLLGEKLDK